MSDLQLYFDPLQDRLGTEGSELDVPQSPGVPLNGYVDEILDDGPADEQHWLPVCDLSAAEDGHAWVAEVSDEALERHV